MNTPNSNRASSTDIAAKAGSNSAQSDSEKARKGEQGARSYGSPDSDCVQHKTDTPPDVAPKTGSVVKPQLNTEGILRKVGEKLFTNMVEWHGLRPVSLSFVCRRSLTVAQW